MARIAATGIAGGGTPVDMPAGSEAVLFRRGSDEVLTRWAGRCRKQACVSRWRAAEERAGKAERELAERESAELRADIEGQVEVDMPRALHLVAQHRPW